MLSASNVHVSQGILVVAGRGRVFENLLRKSYVFKKCLCVNGLAQVVVLTHTGDGAGVMVLFACVHEK